MGAWALEEAAIPCYEFPEPAVQTLARMALVAERRGAPVDRPALGDTIPRFARIGVDLPELAEIEINPLMAGPDGAVAVDARARLDR